MSGAFLIYSEYFGLNGRPFSLLPNPDFLYWSEAHTRAYAMLEYGLATAAPITVITGEVGAGKTTLIRHLLRSAPSDLRFALISCAHGQRSRLLNWVLLALGKPAAPRAPYVELFPKFERLLKDELAAGRRTVLIFDEAQNLSAAMLEELRSFSNINVDRDEVLQIVLVGQPELREVISRPRLLPFAQRVSADFHLPGMPSQGVRKYIEHRLRIAGAQREIFTPAACEAVFAASRGLPRLINQICDYALVYAFAQELPVVHADLIQKVVADRRNYPLNLAGLSAHVSAQGVDPSEVPSGRLEKPASKRTW